jgi:hypothetical protein
VSHPASRTAKGPLAVVQCLDVDVDLAVFEIEAAVGVDQQLAGLLRHRIR